MGHLAQLPIEGAHFIEAFGIVSSLQDRKFEVKRYSAPMFLDREYQLEISFALMDMLHEPFQANHKIVFRLHTTDGVFEFPAFILGYTVSDQIEITIRVCGPIRKLNTASVVDVISKPPLQATRQTKVSVRLTIAEVDALLGAAQSFHPSETNPYWTEEKIKVLARAADELALIRQRFRD